MKKIKPLWVVLFLIIVPISAYLAYFGFVIGEIALPGGYRLTLRDDSLPPRNIENLSKEELDKRQAQLKQRFKELEQKVKQPQVALPFQQVNFDLNGIWYGPGTLSYQIVQNGTTLAIQEMNPSYGIAAIGSGQIQGESIIIDYQTVYNTQGIANLNLAPDKRTLEGIFRDTYSGYTTKVTLNR